MIGDRAGDGREALARLALQADREDRRVPVIVLTTEAGARLCTTKPFAPETLAVKISQCRAAG